MNRWLHRGARRDDDRRDDLLGSRAAHRLTAQPRTYTARELLPLVYEQMRSAARGMMAEERRDHTLRPMAPAHEAYARLARALLGAGQAA